MLLPIKEIPMTLNFYPEPRYLELYEYLKTPQYKIKAIEGIDRTGKTTLFQATRHLVSETLRNPNDGFSPSLGIDILGTKIFITLPWRGDKIYPVIKHILSSTNPSQVTPEFRQATFALFEYNSYSAFRVALRALKEHYGSRYTHKDFTFYLDRSWLSGFAYQDLNDLLSLDIPVDSHVQRYHLYPIDCLYYLYPSFDSSETLNSYDKWAQSNREKLLDSYTRVIRSAKSLGLVTQFNLVYKPLPHIL